MRIPYNVVVSAPHLHSYDLEWLSHKLVTGARCLDVGSGSGILCAMFYEMVKNEDGSAHVYGIDHIEGLTNWSIDNLNKSYSKQLSDGSIKIIHGDGRNGYAEGAPYDVIQVGAAAP